MSNSKNNENHNDSNKKKGWKIVEGLAAANTIRNAASFVKAAGVWVVEAVRNLGENMPDDWTDWFDGMS